MRKLALKLQQDEIGLRHRLILVGGIINLIWAFAGLYYLPLFQMPHFLFSLSISLISFGTYSWHFLKPYSYHQMILLGRIFCLALMAVQTFNLATIPNNFIGAFGVLILIPAYIGTVMGFRQLNIATAIMAAGALSQIVLLETDVSGWKTMYSFALISSLVVAFIHGYRRNQTFGLLSESEAAKNTMIQSMRDGLIVVGLDGHVTHVNDAASQILDLKWSETIGKKFPSPDWILLNEEMSPLPATAAPINPARLVQENLRNYTLGIQRLGQNVKWLRMNSVPLPRFSDAGHQLEIQAIMLTFSDITEMRKAQQELLQNQVALAQSSRLSSLGEMAGGIAHEINNPLAIVHGNLQILKKQVQHSGAEARDFESKIDRCLNAVHRIAKIIKSMKSLSRDSSTDEPVPHRLKDIFENTTAICLEKIHLQGIKLKSELDHSAVVCVHESEIGQVFLNLIQNSIDALEKSPVKEISVTSRIQNGTVLIQFQDTGPGIPAEFRQKIMQPFFTTKEVGRGTGLGLSISQKIMQKHGGSLRLDPDNSKTSFVLELPLYQIQPMKSESSAS